MDGYSKEAYEAEVFKAEYLLNGSQIEKAGELGISISTYKRRLKKVKQYVEKECFTDYIFEA
jgi:hypothetical protein